MESGLYGIRHEGFAFDGAPSSVGWTDGMGKSCIRTISEDICKLQAGQLEQAAFACTCLSQQCRTLGNKSFTVLFGYSAKWVDDLVKPNNEIPPAFEKVISIIDIHLLCHENIKLANKDYAKYHNAKR